MPEAKSKIHTMIDALEAAGFKGVQWYNTGGGCMCVRIPLGDDKTDWSDILIGEGGPPMGPDSFGYGDLDDDEHVTGVWFASTSDANGEAVEAPLLMAGDTEALIAAIKQHVAAR